MRQRDSAVNAPTAAARAIAGAMLATAVVLVLGCETLSPRGTASSGYPEGTERRYSGEIHDTEGAHPFQLQMRKYGDTVFGEYHDTDGAQPFQLRTQRYGDMIYGEYHDTDGAHPFQLRTQRYGDMIYGEYHDTDGAHPFQYRVQDDE